MTAQDCRIPYDKGVRVTATDPATLSTVSLFGDGQVPWCSRHLSV